MDYEIMMNGIVKIGTYAPDFEAQTTMGNINLRDYKGKWVVLFSHRGTTYTEIFLCFFLKREFRKTKKEKYIDLSQSYLALQLLY